MTIEIGVLLSDTLLYVAGILSLGFTLGMIFRG